MQHWKPIYYRFKSGRPDHFVCCEAIRKTVEREHLQSKLGIFQLTVIFAISSLEILTFAIPYVIARVAIKDEKKRFRACIICFALWLLASFGFLILAVSYPFHFLLPYTREMTILLLIILGCDLITQIRTL